jgi:hypothetical protein
MTDHIEVAPRKLHEDLIAVNWAYGCRIRNISAPPPGSVLLKRASLNEQRLALSILARITAEELLRDRIVLTGYRRLAVLIWKYDDGTIVPVVRLAVLIAVLGKYICVGMLEDERAEVETKQYHNQTAET